MAYSRRYNYGGGAGFGGNAWVSLLGGAAQGLLSAQQQRAKMIQQAQEEALRRAAEQRAIDAAQREQERLKMAREASDRQAREARKAEEERQAELRKRRDEEMRQRQRATALVEEWGQDSEMTGYWTPTELKTLADRVAAGDIDPGKVRPPKPTTPELRFYTQPTEYRKVSGAEFIDRWEKENLGVNTFAPEPEEGELGPIRIPPRTENVTFDQQTGQATGIRFSSREQAYNEQLIPMLMQTINEMNRIASQSEPGSQQWYEARRIMEEANSALAEARRRLNPTGDFAQMGGNAFSGVNTNPNRQ